MTATLDTPTSSTPTSSTPTSSTPTGNAPAGSTGYPNARGEGVFLTAQDYTLTARQLVLALSTHLARFGDTLTVKVVDPLAAVDAVMRFDGADITSWTTTRTPDQVATIRARAEHIARDYFGPGFPAIPW